LQTYGLAKAPPATWVGDEVGGIVGLDDDGRLRGRQRQKYNEALQDAVNQFRQQICGGKRMLTLSKLKNWIRQNVSYKRKFSFEPPIPNCDELYIDGKKLVWTDRDGREVDMALKSLSPYLSRANASDKA
jgi:hypothetical protein